MQNKFNRAGRYITQSSGYKAFIPNPLPPDPPLDIDGGMQILLSSADRAIGRLDAATELLPNPNLFVAMYIRKEAVYSSQIEGTQASLSDLLEFEAKAFQNGAVGDVWETINYVEAMNHGLDRLKSLELSLRLIREIHQILLTGVRGGARNPGEFRSSQNWIGPSNRPISEAIFVPPPPQEILPKMGDLELFIQEKTKIPPLIKCGLVHAQFETIHPFLDGNGRIGRLLITFMLCWRNVLQRPLLYLSHYFKQNRDEYYSRLQSVRDKGDWEEWMNFFLKGVRSVASEGADTARKIQNLRDEHRNLIGQRTSQSGLVLLDHLFRQPVVSVNQVMKAINRQYPASNNLINTFQELSLLEEITGQKRNKLFAYQPYLELVEAKIPIRRR